MIKPEDIPNFAAWSNKNLADFATDAYLRMQEMAYDLEQERLNAKAALEAARRLMKENNRDA
jgi:hypothetical protein